MARSTTGTTAASSTAWRPRAARACGRTRKQGLSLFSLSLLEQFARGKGQCLRAERFLDAQPFVPLRHALGAREAADLELADAPADCHVHDRYILGFAGPRGNDRAIAGDLRRA